MDPPDKEPSDPDLELFLEELRSADAARGRSISTERPALPRSPAGYRLLHELQRGGQGIVYAAVQEPSQTPVALKVLLERTAPSSAARRRFEREVELIGELRHPGIVTLYDSGLMPDGRLFLAMELIEGRQLDDYVLDEAGGPRPELAELLNLFLQVGSALEYAHRHRVVHRDLKPQNVLVDTHGVVRLLDFGVAKVLAEKGGDIVTQLTATGEFLGSIAWAAPEQLSRQGLVDTRTDVYALGLLLYFLLTGKLPYDVGTSVSDAVAAVVERPPQPPSLRGARLRIARDLDAIVLRALQKDPNARYAGVGDFCEDVRRFLVGSPVKAREQDARYLLTKLARRNPFAVALLTVLVVLATALGWQREVRSSELARERSGARVAEGRMWGAVGRAVDAEDCLWTELLEPPPGETRPIAQRSATWALRGLYAQHPCVLTKELGYGSFRSVVGGKLLFQTIGEDLGLALFSLPDLAPLGPDLSLPEDASLFTGQLSNDGRWVVAVLMDGQTLLRDLRSDVGWIPGPAQAGQTLHPKGRDEFFSFGTDGIVWSWRATDPSHRAKLFELPLTPDLPRVAIQADRDGRRLMLRAGHRPMRYTVVDIDERRIVYEFHSGDTCHLSADGRFMIEQGYELLVRSLPRLGSPSSIRPVFNQSGATLGSVAVHPERNLVAWSGAPAHGIQLLNLDTLNVEAVLTGQREPVASHRFAHGGRFLLSLDFGGVAKVWLLDRVGKKLGGPDVHRGTISDVCFDASGRYLASAGSVPSVVAIWDVETRQLQQTISGHEGRVSGVDLDPDGRGFVASSCFAGGVYLNDWRTGSEARQIGRHDGPVEAVRFSPAGDELASIGGGELVIWDLSGAEPARFTLPQADRRHGCLAWDRTGAWIALGQTVGRQTNSNLVWFRRSTGTFHATSAGFPVRSLGYSSELDRFAAGADDGSVSLWPPGASEPEDRLGSFGGMVYGVAFCDEHDLLAVAGRTGRVSLLDSKTLEVLLEFQAHDTPVFGLALAPGSGRLATSCELIEVSERGHQRDHAELLLWDLFAADVSLRGNFESRVAALTLELGREPRAAEEVARWLQTIDPLSLLAPVSPDERARAGRERSIEAEAELARLRVEEARMDGDPERRRSRLAELVRQFPAHPEPRTALATELESAGSWPAALGHWRDALALAPNRATSHRSLGAALVRASRALPADRARLLAEASEVLRTATGLDADDGEAWILLGEALRDVGMSGELDWAVLNEASNAADQARELLPHRPEARLNIRWLRLYFGLSRDRTSFAELLSLCAADIEYARARSDPLELARSCLRLHDMFALHGDPLQARAILDRLRSEFATEARARLEVEFLTPYRSLSRQDRVPEASRSYVLELLEQGL